MRSLEALMPFWVPLVLVAVVYAAFFKPRNDLLEHREGHRIHLRVSPYAAVLRVDGTIVARVRGPARQPTLRLTHTTDAGLEITAGQRYDKQGRLEPYIQTGRPPALPGPAVASLAGPLP